MNAVRIRLISVPPTVTMAETPRARKIVGVERMYRYASRLKVSGQRMNGRVASSPGRPARTR